MGDLFQLIWMRFGKSNACRAHAFLIDGEQKLSQICTCQRTCLSMHIYCHAHTCPSRSRENQNNFAAKAVYGISLSVTALLSRLYCCIPFRSTQLRSAPPQADNRSALSLSLSFSHITQSSTLSLSFYLSVPPPSEFSQSLPSFLQNDYLCAPACLSD